MDASTQLTAALSGRYVVEREIGAGGMATVYLARDVKHDRHVALKVLNPELGAVLGVDRFLAEIKVTANLQHPNLLPLFDSGTVDGLLFYVMPFVQGESLRHRLARDKQLPVDDAIHIAVAIAGALDYAHRHGVIHRDLKPENILLHEGQPLVADFGIALAVSNAGGTRITQTGLSLGTPQYMSPEQATGDRVIDGRTDIYSLGAVTYEMLTGEPPHTGTTAQAVIAKVLMDKPRGIRLTRDTVSREVEAAVERALAKLPADRFATAQEFAAAIGVRGASGSVSVSAARISSPAVRRSKPWLTVGATVIGALAVAAAGIGADRWVLPHRAEAVSFLIEPPMLDGAKARFGMIGLSPDGQTVAFVAVNDTAKQIFVRRLSDATPRALAGTRGAYDLFFSPDSKTIAFFTMDGHLRSIPVDGGSPITLAATPSYYAGGAWWRDQQIIIGAQGSENGLRRLNAAGGESKAINTSKTPLARPVVTPDGETVLFTDWGPGFTEDDFLGIGSRSTGRFTTTKLLIAGALGVVDGYAIVSTANGAIKAVPFDAKSQRLTGDAIPIQEDIAPNFSNSATGVAPFAKNGTFAYLRGSGLGQLTFVDSTTNRLLVNERRSFQTPAVSPDGRRVAVDVIERGDTTTSDIFTIDIAAHTISRVTSRGDATTPTWTPDGKSILFTTWFQTMPSVWRQPADGQGAAVKLLEIPSGGDELLSAVSTPDNHAIVFARVSVDELSGKLYLMPLAGDGTPRQIATGSPFAFEPAISPDGRWLAFAGGDAGPVGANIFVVSLTGSPQRVQVSFDTGDEPMWSRDGSSLYYRHAGGIVAATLTRSGATLQVASRAALFPSLQQFNYFAMTPDGKHAITVKPDADDIRLAVVTNWVQRVRDRIVEATGGK